MSREGLGKIVKSELEPIATRSAATTECLIRREMKNSFLAR
jgi:hypothetical protein